MCERILLSDEAEAFEFEEVPEPIRIGEVAEASSTVVETDLKTQTLPPLVSFFIFANFLLIIDVTALGAFENYLKWSDVLVTDKVLIALITGVTVQMAAVIVAAYKGLFS